MDGRNAFVLGQKRPNPFQPQIAAAVKPAPGTEEEHLNITTLAKIPGGLQDALLENATETRGIADNDVPQKILKHSRSWERQFSQARPVLSRPVNFSVAGMIPRVREENRNATTLSDRESIGNPAASPVSAPAIPVAPPASAPAVLATSSGSAPAVPATSSGSAPAVPAVTPSQSPASSTADVTSRETSPDLYFSSSIPSPATAVLAQSPVTAAILAAKDKMGKGAEKGEPIHSLISEVIKSAEVKNGSLVLNMKTNVAANKTMNVTQPNKAMVQPGVENKGFVQPGLANKGIVQPELANKLQAQPEMISNGLVQPALVNKEQVQPEMVNKGMVQPEMANKGRVKWLKGPSNRKDRKDVVLLDMLTPEEASKIPYVRTDKKTVAKKKQKTVEARK